MRTAALAVLALGLAAAVLSPAPAARAQEEAQDTVVRKNNSKVQGTIQSEDSKGCQIMVAGTKATTQVLWSDVKSVDYGGSPEFRQARRATDAGDTRTAIPLLEKMKKDTATRDVLKPHVLNLLGLNFYREGQFDKAIENYADLFGRYPKIHLIASGGKNLVNSYLAKQDAAGADAALQKMVSAGADQTQLGLLKAQVAEAKKSWIEAISGYKSVREAATDEGAKAEADLGIGRCLLGQNKTSEAETTFKGITSKDGLSNVVLAGAWNGLADVTYKNGFDKRDPEALTVALYQYLRGCVQYTPNTGDPTTEFEHAVWGAARCFEALSQLETKDEAKKQYARRGKERREFLQTKFPSSAFLQLK